MSSWMTNLSLQSLWSGEQYKRIEALHQQGLHLLDGTTLKKQEEEITQLQLMTQETYEKIAAVETKLQEIESCIKELK